jgi:GT2 family glycosyltransferase
MSIETKVSLVIVSRGRPEALRRVLSSLRFQSHRPFEVVVVSDQSSIDYINDVAPTGRIKHIFFDVANISAARNLGIAKSGGDVIAFCDDDAIPEPMWLARLAEVFDEIDVGAAGGLVRGRNGFSVQWGEMVADNLGRAYTKKTQPAGSVIKTVLGTNCAFRKSALEQIGGFDEAFKFFLEETDACLRLSHLNWQIRYVEDAEVQHGYEESAERSANRVPKTLINLGRSKMIFLRKHASDAEKEIELSRFKEEQRQRLIEHMNMGLIEPRVVGRLLNTLTDGYKIGEQIILDEPSLTGSTKFLPFITGPPVMQGLAVVGSFWQKAELATSAIKAAKDNRCVTVFRFSRSSLFHHRYYDADGYWVQTGGLYGRSARIQPVLKLYKKHQRISVEIKILDKQRSISDIVVV